MVSNIPSDSPRKDNIEALQETLKVCMSTITKQALIAEFGVLRATTLTNNHVCSKKLKYVMHESINPYLIDNAWALYIKCMLTINAQTNQTKTQQSDMQQSLGYK